MNNLETQKGIVDAFFEVLDSCTPQEMGQRISQLMDEQPHAMGFLFNLDEDFTEAEHNYILKSAIVVRDVFISAGIPFDVVYADKIQEIIEELVKVYDKLAENEEINNLKNWVENANSPILFENVLGHNPAQTAVQQDMALIIDLIIGIFEEATADTKDNPLTGSGHGG